VRSESSAAFISASDTGETSVDGLVAAGATGPASAPSWTLRRRIDAPRESTSPVWRRDRCEREIDMLGALTRPEGARRCDKPASEADGSSRRAGSEPVVGGLGAAGEEVVGGRRRGDGAVTAVEVDGAVPVGLLWPVDGAEAVLLVDGSAWASAVAGRRFFLRFGAGAAAGELLDPAAAAAMASSPAVVVARLRVRLSGGRSVHWPFQRWSFDSHCSALDESARSPRELRGAGVGGAGRVGRPGKGKGAGGGIVRRRRRRRRRR